MKKLSETELCGAKAHLRRFLSFIHKYYQATVQNEDGLCSQLTQMLPLKGAMAFVKGLYELPLNQML